MQTSFNPFNIEFKWTNDWYTWDHELAKREARRLRDDAYKALIKKGIKARKFTLPGQLCTKGGIGTGHPEINAVVNVYYVEYEYKIEN